MFVFIINRNSFNGKIITLEEHLSGEHERLNLNYGMEIL